MCSSTSHHNKHVTVYRGKEQQHVRIVDGIISGVLFVPLLPFAWVVHTALVSAENIHGKEKEGAVSS